MTSTLKFNKKNTVNPRSLKTRPHATLSFTEKRAIKKCFCN